VSAWGSDSLRSSELESRVDLLYSTHVYKAFLLGGEAAWAEGHLFNFFCKDKWLACVLGSGNSFGFPSVEALHEQRQSIASAFVKLRAAGLPGTYSNCWITW